MINLQLIHYYSWFQCPVCLLWKNRVRDIVDHIVEKHPDKEGVLINCIDCGQHLSSSTLLVHVQSCLKTVNMSKKEGSLNDRWAFQHKWVIPIKELFLIFRYGRKNDFAGTSIRYSQGILNKTGHRDLRTQHERYKMDIDKMVPCDKCGKSFNRHYALEKHIRKAHGNLEGKFQHHCRYCNLSFP